MRNKKKVLLIILSFVILACKAQVNQAPDASPLNVAYLPYNFAHDRVFAYDSSLHEKAFIKVYYSQPKKNNRKIFGSLVPFGEVWRTGANETVQIMIYQDLNFGGKPLKAGTYSLFTIPNKQEWIIIINSDLDYWGAYTYNQENDVIRVTVSSKPLTKTIESFSIIFDNLSDNQAVMKMAWDQTLVEVPITY